jgi:hypothetical protein
MAFADGDSLLAAVCAEIEKGAPLVFVERTEGFESTDETNVASPEEASFTSVVGQRTDVIRVEVESPRAAVRGRVLDEKKCVAVEAKVT